MTCLSKYLYSLFIFSHEGMTDLIALLGSLVDANGRIKVPGVYDSVAELTSEEEKLYGPIDFSMVSGDIKKTNKLV